MNPITQPSSPVGAKVALPAPADLILFEKIGDGGAGEVYQGYCRRLRRRVAVKLLAPERASDPSSRTRFRSQARAAMALVHPNICAVHRLGEEAGIDYMVMELIRGRTLRQRLGRAPMRLVDILPIAGQILQALAWAHARRVVHGDLKPDNVMLTSKGAVKVLDFGLAMRDPQPFRGALATPAYMSPEQIRCESIDARSDLFAFGVVLYEMANGRKPFAGETLFDMLASIVGNEPLEVVPGTTGPLVDRVVRRCLEKDPGARYQRAEEILADLGNAASTAVGVETAGATSVIRFRPNVRTKPGGES